MECSDADGGCRSKDRTFESNEETKKITEKRFNGYNDHMEVSPKNSTDLEKEIKNLQQNKEDYESLKQMVYEQMLQYDTYLEFSKNEHCKRPETQIRVGCVFEIFFFSKSAKWNKIFLAGKK